MFESLAYTDHRRDPALESSQGDQDVAGDAEKAKCHEQLRSSIAVDVHRLQTTIKLKSGFWIAGVQTEPVFVAPHLQLEETVPGHADDVLRLCEGDATAEGDGGRLGEDAALHRHLGRHPGLAGSVHTSVSTQWCSGDRVWFA